MTEPQKQFDPVAMLLRRWRISLLFTAAGAAAGVAYGYLATPWYSATLTVVPSERSHEGLALSLASKLPEGLDTFSTDVQRIDAVLASNSVADAVIDKFNLQDRYGKPHREQTREALREHCGTAVDRRSNVVTLTCEDTDPKQAMELATYFGEEGNRVFGRVSASSAAEERKFLETQVVKAEHDVDEASRKLREFQEQHKIIDLPEQSKAVISAMANIEGELLSKQLELSYLTSFSSRNEPSVVQLQQQIGIMQAKLTQLEASQVPSQPSSGSGSGSARGEKGAEFFPNAMNVPALRFELEQLIRQQKIQETVFFLMKQRFEMAKIEEARNTSTFQILDHPTLPSSKSRPRRTRSAIYGLAGGIAAAVLWVVVPVWWRRRNGAAEIT